MKVEITKTEMGNYVSIVGDGEVYYEIADCYDPEWERASLEKMLRAVRAEERERCARVADAESRTAESLAKTARRNGHGHLACNDEARAMVADRIAAAIRALGDE